MPVESAEDRAAFLNIDEFGVAAVYRRRNTLVETDINGIFDNAYIAATADGEMVASSSGPAFIVRTADIPGGISVYDDMIILTSISLALSGLSAAFAGTWLIKQSQPDGTGMTVLWLTRP